MSLPNQILEIEIIQIINLETLPIIETEISPTIGIEHIHMIDIKTTDHAIILTTDQTIIDQNITTIKIDQAIIHEIEIQVITKDKETTLRLHIGITHLIRIHNKVTGVVHLNIKGK